MPGLTDILSLAHSGLTAARVGIHTVGQNVSNSNTPGYHRRVHTQETRQGVKVGGNYFLGMGVKTTGPERIVDDVIDNRRRNARSDMNFAGSRSNMLSRTEVIFGDLDSVGLTPALDRFFDALDALTAQPQDAAIRTQALSAAEFLANQVADRAQDLRDIRQSLDEIVVSEVGSINTKLAEIAELNEKLRFQPASPNDLLDQRANLLDSLAEQIGVNVLDNGDGTVNVFLDNGFALVLENEARELTAAVAPTGLVNVFATNTVHDATGTLDLTSNLNGGSLGGVLAARDQDILQLQENLDQFAFDFINSVNAVHVAGAGLDGVSGRNLFTPPPPGVTGAAESMSIDAAVAGNTDALATRSVIPGPPPVPAGLGDNQNALDLAALRDINLASGAPPAETIRSILGAFGDRVHVAEIDVVTSVAAEKSITDLQQSISGVNIDEEMLNMLKFREAFSAAAKMVRTADEMIQEVIALKR
ncbi:MAG: flagellar hook-associated protein FlgK [Myxococcales bacterium]|nr:flagellar hook-associated protein FlgK [Myxococcales bacterium]